MRSIQLRFWPDPQPLVERLGRGFFRELPARPGVYLMRDGAGQVLYVGKAKSLRQRLGSYRTANPDRMPHRTLRLLRLVEQIEWRLCDDEAAALACEAELLRGLRPRFNRAGTWPGPERYLAWRPAAGRLELAVIGSPIAEWRVQGPMGRRARFLHAVLARLVWVAAHPERGVAGLPAGWFGGELGPEVGIECGAILEALTERLDQLGSGRAEVFCEWMRAQVSSGLSLFDRAVIEADLEWLADVGAV